MTDDRLPSQAVKSYGAGIQARNLQRQEERSKNPVFPNLAQAAVTYRPDSPQTLEQVAQQQRADAHGAASGAPPAAHELSPQTVEGLRALHAAQAAASTQPPAPAARAEAPSEEPKAPAAEEELDIEDEALADAIRGVRQDVIQNERERKAVAKRVAEIDLAEGLLTGEFTQLVPIVPGKLEVRFRCLTTGENNALRLHLFDELRADLRKERIAAELLAFYQTVASVVSINKTTYARHMTPGALNAMEFQQPVFQEKVNAFMQFPLPLISSLGTHAAWFEERVRELFATTERIKNG